MGFGGWSDIMKGCLYIHLFAFCKSIQGLRQPIGYRICHIANNVYKLNKYLIGYILT